MAIVVAAVAIALLAGAPATQRAPLDPASTAPDGTRALVLLLRQQGAQVSVSAQVPEPGAGGVALVLSDNLDDAQRTGLRQWVEGGGTLVVADPESDLAGAAAFESTDEGRLRPACALPALADVDQLDVPGAALYRPPPGTVACFPDEARHGGRPTAFLVARSEGRGSVIALGGPDAFVNGRLGKGDNSVLAVRLLVPTAAATVVILQPPRVGEGRKRLGDLVPRRVKAGLLELIVAFAVLCLWRARRLGRPVLEPQPVELAGSELVVAVGHLLQQGRRRGHAARVLRDELRRTLAERLNLGRDTPLDVVVDVASARTGVDRRALAAALGGDDPDTDAGLVALAQSTEAVHEEVVHAR